MSAAPSGYVPVRSRGPDDGPPSPKNRASAGSSARCTHRTAPPSVASHQRGGNSRRRRTPPGVRSSTAPSRDTDTVRRSDTTCQPPSVPGSSRARGSGAGSVPGRPYDGSLPAPSHAQNTAPPAATRMLSSERANRTTPPPGPGSAPSSGPGTLASSGPRCRGAQESPRHALQAVRTPPTEPINFTERTRS